LALRLDQSEQSLDELALRLDQSEQSLDELALRLDQSEQSLDESALQLDRPEHWLDEFELRPDDLELPCRSTPDCVTARRIGIPPNEGAQCPWLVLDSMHQAS